MIQLTIDTIKLVASKVNIEAALLCAVDLTESNGSGYYLDEGKNKGQLKVLFEGHYFHKFTKGQFGKLRPDLSYSKWTRRYYRRGQKEFDRYMEARSYAKIAALLSTSWGRYQIMGANYALCGYDSVVEMVTSFYSGGEPEQLLAFISFLLHKEGVTKYGKSTGKTLFAHLKDKEFEYFVGGYNGLGNIPQYKSTLINNYNKAKKQCQ